MVSTLTDTLKCVVLHYRVELNRVLIDCNEEKLASRGGWQKVILMMKRRKCTMKEKLSLSQNLKIEKTHEMLQDELSSKEQKRLRNVFFRPVLVCNLTFGLSVCKWTNIIKCLIALTPCCNHYFLQLIFLENFNQMSKDAGLPRNRGSSYKKSFKHFKVFFHGQVPFPWNKILLLVLSSTVKQSHSFLGQFKNWKWSAIYPMHSPFFSLLPIPILLLDPFFRVIAKFQFPNETRSANYFSQRKLTSDYSI